MSGFDTVIAGGTVIDGTESAEPRLADVGITDGMIVATGDLSGVARSATIDAAGRVVAPGFVDTHTHIELTGLVGSPDRTAAVQQGITTVLAGADGFGWVGIPEADRQRWWDDHAALYGEAPDTLPEWRRPDDFLDDVRSSSLHDVVPLVPHGNIRAAVMGSRPGPASPTELKAMIDEAEAWLQAGAVGMATGLDYLPGRYAATDEIIALARVVAEGGGVYASHVRLTDFGREEAWREAARIGEAAGLGVRIAHERIDALSAPLLDELSQRVDLTVDSYVYPAGCTSLTFHVPAADLSGGVMALADRLSHDAAFADRLAGHLDAKLTANPGQQALVAGTKSGRHNGRTLREIADRASVTVGRAAVDMLRDEMPFALLIYVWQATDDGEWDRTVERTLTSPHTFIATDGVYFGTHAHPRGFGTFPRIIADYVRGAGLLSLGAAIHKMTGFPAAAYGLDDRGLIETGRRADMVVFDPDEIGCAADTNQPRQRPTGIDQVLVAGHPTIEGPEPADRLQGAHQ